MWQRIQQKIWVLACRLATPLFFKLTVTGRENLPPDNQALIIVCNHFSFFEAFFILTQLPYTIRFFAATETQRHRFLGYIFRLFDAIPVWRGQADRNALKIARDALENRATICIFPEGGIVAELQEMVRRGEKMDEDERAQGMVSRIPPVLIPVPRGTAYLATQTDTQLLPIAILGGEQVAGNLGFPWKRTPVAMHIGRPFGPLVLDETLRGASKKARQQELSDLIMTHIAALVPPEQRGPYQDLTSISR